MNIAQKRVVRWALVPIGLAIVLGVVLAQGTVRGKRQAQKPKFDDTVGTMIITGFSKDQIWAVALKILKAEKMEVAKTSESFIFARQTTSDRVEVDLGIVDHPRADSMRPWAPAVVLSVDAPIYGELGEFRSMSKGQRFALSRQLATKIIDVLYSPPTK